MHRALGQCVGEAQAHACLTALRTGALFYTTRVRLPNIRTCTRHALATYVDQATQDDTSALLIGHGLLRITLGAPVQHVAALVRSGGTLGAGRAAVRKATLFSVALSGANRQACGTPLKSRSAPCMCLLSALGGLYASQGNWPIAPKTRLLGIGSKKTGMKQRYPVAHTPDAGRHG